MNKGINLRFEGAFSLEEIQEISNNIVNFTITELDITQSLALVEFGEVGLNLRSRTYKSKDSFIDTLCMRSDKAALSDKPRPGLWLTKKTNNGITDPVVEIFNY